MGEANDLAGQAPEKAAELQKMYDQWNAENVEPKWQPTAEFQRAKKRRNRQRAQRRARQQQVQQERAAAE